MANKNKSIRIDKTLIERAIKRDQSACTTIVTVYRNALFVHISTYISQSEDVEDICQETFQKCFKNLASYDPKYAFSTWLYTIAENCAFDFYRKKKLPMLSTDILNSDEATYGAVNNSPGPEESMINTQEIESLIKSIQTLNIKYRKIAELRFIHEYPIEEIAKELSIPINTVKTRISRARKTLIEQWKS